MTDADKTLERFGVRRGDYAYGDYEGLPCVIVAKKLSLDDLQKMKVELALVEPKLAVISPCSE